MSADIIPYTDTQARVIAVLPRTTSPWSVIGSTLIIYAILSEENFGLNSVYNRLMLGLSSMDVLVSLSIIVFGPWAMPKEAEFLVQGARGTIATCNAAGWFLTLIVGSICYTAFRCLYYLLLIRFEYREETIAKRVEPFMHSFSILFPLILGSIAVAKEFTSPLDMLRGFCWIQAFPPGCERGDDVECIRGEGARLSGTAAAGCVVLAWVLIVVCMVCIYNKVKKVERRIRRYSGGRRRSVTRETGYQALLYIGAFFLCYSFLTALQLLDNWRKIADHPTLIFVLSVFGQLLFPLQGFFNAFIYFRQHPLPMGYPQRLGCLGSRKGGPSSSNPDEGDVPAVELENRESSTHDITNSAADGGILSETESSPISDYSATCGRRGDLSKIEEEELER